MENNIRQTGLGILNINQTLMSQVNQDWHPGLELKAEQWPEVKSMTMIMTGREIEDSAEQDRLSPVRSPVLL